MMRRRHRKPPSRGGYAVFLVLLTLAIAFVIGLTFLHGATTTTAVAQTMNEHAQARQVAESGIDAVLRYVERTPTWRSDQSPGEWLTDAPLLGGAVSVTTDYDPTPTLDPVGVANASFEDATTALSNPLLNPPMSGSFEGWQMARTAVIETGVTVPWMGVESSAYATDGNRRAFVTFLASVDGTASFRASLPGPLLPRTNYALRVDAGRQLLGQALADASLRV